MSYRIKFFFNKIVGYAEQRKESIRRKSLWQTRGYRVEKERFQRFKENQGFGHDFLDPTHTKESSEQKVCDIQIKHEIRQTKI